MVETWARVTVNRLHYISLTFHFSNDQFLVNCGYIQSFVEAHGQNYNFQLRPKTAVCPHKGLDLLTMNDLKYFPDKLSWENYCVSYFSPFPQANVSRKRLQEFLERDELDPNNVQKRKSKSLAHIQKKKCKDSEFTVEISGLYFLYRSAWRMDRLFQI